MKKLYFYCFALSFFFLTQISFSKIIEYSSPLNGAKYVNFDTKIIIKFSENVDINSAYNNSVFTIQGSGRNDYKFNLISTSGVIIIQPLTSFMPGEKITVKINKGLKLKNGSYSDEQKFSFYISNISVKQPELAGFINELSEQDYLSLVNNSLLNPGPPPQINVLYSNNPAPGHLLISNIVFNTLIPNSPHLIIMNNDATPVFTRQMGGQIFDFNMQPNGNYTYFNRIGAKYYELDTAYNLVDSFFTGNGYLTDIHELRVLPNRHALLMSYDKQVVNMSPYVQGGDTAALVTGLIIQEIDESKNVIFQWRSWDHIPITDAEHQDLTDHEIDYVHGNALELDFDGNILLSSRHLDEITKINRTTGDIIWRWGGKKNEFTFQNDFGRFNYQHGIRRLLNGNYIMFDNGNFHSPVQSRAVEYILDQENKIATKVWEYKNTPLIFGYAMGFAQRLENGNTLISWGATNPTLTEVKPDGSKALEMNLPQNVFTYRAFKYNNENLTSNGNISANIPKTFNLYQNYPNPFNPVTKIKFDLPEQGFTTLKIFNSLGEYVSTLVNEKLNAGEYEKLFDASFLSSGIYFYSLNVNGFHKTNKLVLIK